MAKFNDFYRNNDQNQDFLKKMSDPLKKSFGIDVFWYSKIEENGQFACLCSYNDAFGHFWENSCYKDMAFYVSPSQLKSGSYLLDHDTDYSRYMDSTSVDYPLYHPMLVVRKTLNNKAELFGFASTKHTPSLGSLYMNNMGLLNSFIDYYLSCHKPQKTEIDLAELIGHDIFYKNDYGHTSATENVAKFLKDIGVSHTLLSAGAKLTPREKEVLICLYDGKNSIETGVELELSHRTVQFYLENCKNKLGILSRAELIQSLKFLKLAGLLES
jgi:DNA-binding CsgD family transcriptional regulator